MAKRLVDCLRRNEGLYVKFGQAMSTMEAHLEESWQAHLASSSGKFFQDFSSKPESHIGYYARRTPARCCALSLAKDIVLPEEYKTELRSLHDQAATFDFPQAQSVVTLPQVQ